MYNHGIECEKGVLTRYISFAEVGRCRKYDADLIIPVLEYCMFASP